MTVITTAEDGRALLPTRAAQMAAAPATDTSATTTAVSPVELAATAPVQEVQPLDLDALVAALEQRMSIGRVAGASHPLNKFSNAQAWLLALRSGDRDALATFAIAEQTTAESPGVMANGWITDIKRIVDLGARAINALGGRAPLPDQGMSIDFPYVAEDLTTLVGVQATQLTDVTSVDVEILKGTAAIKTLAGGSTLAWQLIERSSPSYVEAYLRLLAIAFGLVENKTFTTDVVAAAGSNIDQGWELVGTTEAQIKATAFDASVQVEAATGAPASVILAATDVFKNLGAKLVSPEYGTSNKEGTASAAGLRIEISGLPVVHDPSIAAGIAIATNELAVRWHGTGPAGASAEDVTRLGRDQVIWGMGSTVAYVPAGIVKIEDVP
jgi:hypothetical protein